MNTSAGTSEATFPSSVTDLGTSLRLVSRTNPGQPEETPVSSADSRLFRLATHLPENEHAWRTRQLRDLGLNADAISILVHQRILIRARMGCYVRAAYWDRFDGTGQDRLRILLHAHAAVTSSPSWSIYSHTSAARRHEPPLWRADPFIHLTRSAKNSTAHKAPDVKIHCRSLPSEMCAEIDGLLVTNILRTTVDCALTMNYQQVLILMDYALRVGVSRAALEQEAAALDGHQGIRIFRAALDFACADSESAGESMTRELIHVCAIEAPQLQYKPSTRNGSYRADFAWPRYKVILEFDGEGKYFNYRPTPQVLRDERKRENELIEQGWTVIRIGWPDLFNEHLFKTRLMAALRKGGMK